ALTVELTAHGPGQFPRIVQLHGTEAQPVYHTRPRDVKRHPRAARARQGFPRGTSWVSARVRRVQFTRGALSAILPAVGWRPGLHPAGGRGLCKFYMSAGYAPGWPREFPSKPSLRGTQRRHDRCWVFLVAEPRQYCRDGTEVLGVAEGLCVCDRPLSLPALPACCFLALALVCKSCISHLVQQG